MNRLLIVDPAAEILALQHLLKRDTAVEPNHIFVRHRAKPIAIADRFGPGRIENFECLLAVGLRVQRNFFMRQMRTRYRPAAWIANHSSEISDDQDGLMPEVLK